NRKSIAVRDRLWARAVAIREGETTLVLVSCDIIGVTRSITRHVRALVGEATGLPPAAIMVHCTHTHSGPATHPIHGWGTPDPPYLSILPHRIARACIEAVGDLSDATLAHAEVPCQGVALNREYDQDAPPLEEVLRDDWRPAKPELVDATCHVLTFRAGQRLRGFASYYGCHPVVCCETTRYIHGDYAGVATNLLERENPGAVGLFLQGAQGDINSCVVHKPEPEALLALDVIAARYANAVRAGVAAAHPVEVSGLRFALREARFPERPIGLERLREWLAEQEAVAAAPGASDADREVRMAAVYAESLRGIIPVIESGRPTRPPTELQGLRIGPIAVLGTPFEMFRAIKCEVVEQSSAPVTLVMGLTNDSNGYAADRTTAARGGYAQDMVPLMLGVLPYEDIHTHLVRELLDLESALRS
ncbi:MAG TPA: neutral/alkaline non-lysosomal ceramidase N-terminal domain-containing protein, partial [Armatimonadota bacterium]|nr:neutral/alkaline non-lysosomal ceramidase N-terminal domain-containing protein [Armatimonadota bacterium]